MRRYRLNYCIYTILKREYHFIKCLRWWCVYIKSQEREGSVIYPLNNYVNDYIMIIFIYRFSRYKIFIIAMEARRPRKGL